GRLSAARGAEDGGPVGPCGPRRDESLAYALPWTARFLCGDRLPHFELLVSTCCLRPAVSARRVAILRAKGCSRLRTSLLSLACEGEGAVRRGKEKRRNLFLWRFAPLTPIPSPPASGGRGEKRGLIVNIVGIAM